MSYLQKNVVWEIKVVVADTYFDVAFIDIFARKLNTLVNVIVGTSQTLVKKCKEQQYHCLKNFTHERFSLQHNDTAELLKVSI